MRIKVMLISSILLLIVGCSDTNNQPENDDNSPEVSDTRYNSSETNHTDPLKRFHDKQNKNNDNNKNNKDVFTNETSIKIKDKLTNRQDIRQAQVAVTKTRAIISVQLSDHANREDILDSIQNEIEQMVADKEIVIYTNDSYWNRMKDLGSNLENLTDDDDIDHYIDEFFNE